MQNMTNGNLQNYDDSTIRGHLDHEFTGITPYPSKSGNDPERDHFRKQGVYKIFMTCKFLTGLCWIID